MSEGKGGEKINLRVDRLAAAMDSARARSRGEAPPEKQEPDPKAGAAMVPLPPGAGEPDPDRGAAPLPTDSPGQVPGAGDTSPVPVPEGDAGSSRAPEAAGDDPLDLGAAAAGPHTSGRAAPPSGARPVGPFPVPDLEAASLLDMNWHTRGVETPDPEPDPAPEAEPEPAPLAEVDQHAQGHEEPSQQDLNWDSVMPDQERSAPDAPLPPLSDEALPSMKEETLLPVPDEALPSVKDETLPSVPDEALPSLKDEAPPSLPDWAIPVLSGSRPAAPAEETSEDLSAPLLLTPDLSADMASDSADRRPVSVAPEGAPEPVAPKAFDPARGPSRPALLALDGVKADIGRYSILTDVGFEVPTGTVTMLLGRNGVGKTTTLRTIMGLVRARAGRIVLAGERIDGWAPHRIARLGVGYVPESMSIFSDLTVAENITLGALSGRVPDHRLDWLLQLFPPLGTFWRVPAGNLSGGQKQMLALARALVEKRQVYLIDEPTKGLAPSVVATVVSALRDLKLQGATILMVEQNFAVARALGDQCVVMDDGQVTWRGEMAQMAADEALQQRLMGLTGDAA